MRILILCLFVAPSLFLLSHPGYAEPMFMGLGDLPGGSYGSYAYDVSSDGSVVVGYSSSGLGGSLGYEAFRWTRSSGMVGLGGFPGVGGSKAWGVSADGSTVVGESAGVAFIWTSHSGMQDLGHLPGGRSSLANGVSADGSTVVGRGVGESGPEAFIWTSDSGMVGLGDLPGGDFESEASGVSADGSTVVGTGTGVGAFGIEAFRWTRSSGMVGLGCPYWRDCYSAAWAVSADGSVVVGHGHTFSGTEPFRWTSSGGMVTLGHLFGEFVDYAGGVSADGSVVVGRGGVLYPGYEFGFEAFIWDTTNGMRELDVVLTDLGLDLAGWELREAWGVSADGRVVVGHGRNPSGQREAWIAALSAPEPSANLLAACALLTLAMWRRRVA